MSRAQDRLLERAPASSAVRARTALPLAIAGLTLALFAAGCPQTLAQLCPAGTQQAGVFTTQLAFNNNDAQQCLITRDANDGGALDASLASPPAAFTSALCSGFDDGGPVVYLALPSIVRESALGDGGTFSFGANTLVQGTACGCTIFVSETISGTLTPAQPDAGVIVAADGTLPALSGFSGSVVDQIDAGGDAGVVCNCNIPCDLQYTLSGSKL